MSPKRLKIVHIDDNPADFESLNYAFERSGLPFEMKPFARGETALQYLFSEAERSPDLVILDLNIPGLHGHQILQCLREHPRTRVTPVIIMSSSRAPSDVSRSYALCANSFIHKPLTLNELMSVASATLTFWSQAVELPTAAA